ncbi:hypothetical protein IV203_018514 [Nitzschia inconspicua]|uniref:Uncharacterized protein n=1 Tax=Nitzschia inconspicua TaxID=303405 RepID=A0A9K3Q6F4_9STRA|nr:hypothetical protein IV203_018514 [Nitzschia inconspicua]
MVRSQSVMESQCNGLTVVLPVDYSYPLYSSLKVLMRPTVMPKDDFLFLEVPGLSINSTHDARLSSVGYAVFKRNGASMTKFHTWYNNKVLIPYFKEVRKRHGLSTESNFSEPELARVYCDSDMTNIACITSYTKMERNLKNGIAFAKFGAKTTDWTQACDVGSGFRTKKSKFRTTIAESCDEALMTTFTRNLESHYILGSLLLKSLGRKHEAIVDCVATAPRVHSHAWNQEKVQAAFIEVVSGYVSGEFFYKLDIAIDMDAKGRQYPLTAASDVRGRAGPLYSQIRIQEMTQEMVDGLEKKRQKRRSVIEAAKCTFQMNLEAASRLQEMADEKYNGSLELLVYEDLFRLNVKHLIPYIQVRQVTDLTEPFKQLKKGTVQQVEEGQSCLLLQAKAVLGKNITAVLPEWSDVTVPSIGNSQNSKGLQCFQQNICFCPHTGLVQGGSQYCPPHFEERQTGVLAITLILLVGKIQSRLPNFLRGRCPFHLQKHWVWTSFIANFLKEISCLIVLTGLESQALKYTTPLESFLNQNLNVFPKNG